VPFERLALPLLVARVLANNHDATVATDDLALVADLLDAGLDLHPKSLSCGHPCLVARQRWAVHVGQVGQVGQVARLLVPIDNASAR